jgi:hypothetical protein
LNFIKIKKGRQDIRMKKFFKFLGILILLLIIAAVFFVVTFKPPTYSDYDVFTGLRSFVPEVLQDAGATERDISKEFETFALDLSFPFNKMFGCSSVGIPLRAFSSDKIATATISQFEAPPSSGYFRDFVLNIRPDYNLQAPAFHMDFMKPSPGTPGLCSIDFFNVDKEVISLEGFFGSDFEIIKEAFESVSKYQRTVEEGRGKITKYLDPYKTAYRMELIEPKDEAERKEYYLTVDKAFKAILPLYLKKVNACEPVDGYAEAHEEKMKKFVTAIYVNDFAVKLGRKMFKDSFKRYWLDGFWFVDMELPEGK